MKDPKPEKPSIPKDIGRGDVKPSRDELPNQRPKPTPNPPKKK